MSKGAKTKKAKTDTTAMRVLVRGKVQAVGYRDATLRRARELGVMGWVGTMSTGMFWRMRRDLSGLLRS